MNIQKVGEAKLFEENPNNYEIDGDELKLERNDRRKAAPIF